MTDQPTRSMSLAEAFPTAQERVRRLRDHGKEIGPSGRFYVMQCEALLRRMDKAAAEQDTVEMLRTYQEAMEMSE